MSLAAYLTIGWLITLLAFAFFAADAMKARASDLLIVMLVMFGAWPMIFVTLIGMAIREAALKARGR